MHRVDRPAVTIGFAVLVTVGFVALFSAGRIAIAQDAADASTADDLLHLLHQEDFGRVHELVAEELASPLTGIERKLELLRASATAHALHHLRHQDSLSLENARTAMETMLRFAPDADFLPGYRYPPPVHSIFQDVRRAWRTAGEEPADPRRVAVAPFFLIDLGAGGDFDWTAFAEALPFIITTDLEAIPGLKLLSREHLDAVGSELSLASRSDLVSAGNRVRLGNLLSAASFIYGEVQALPGDEIWLELRWVQTESGATLLARHGRKRIRRGADLLELEKSVVVESFVSDMLDLLAPDESRAGSERARQHFQRKQSLASRGDTYLAYIAAVAHAVTAEEDGNLSVAIQGWKEASSLLPDLPAPREKLRALELLLPQRDRSGDE